MVVFFAAMASMYVIAALVGQGNPGNHMLVPLAIFVFFGVVATVSIFGLAISANRLARKLGVWNHDVPLWLLYAAGIGSFYSVWLDRKAKQSSLSPGD
jgi:hypothetical protein